MARTLAVEADDDRGVVSRFDRIIARRPSVQERSLLFAAIVVAGILRFASIGSVPPGLNQDEAVNGYDAFSLSMTGRDHHGHPFPFAGLESFGDWASPLLTFITAPVVGLLGLRVEVVRGVSAALGVLLVPIVYRLALELFQRPPIAVVAASMIAISPWDVHRSRFANPAAVVPTVVALTMLALIWTLRRGSSRGVVATAVIAVLAIAAYPTMKLYVPMLLIAAMWIYHRRLAQLNRESLCYSAAIILIIAGPIYYLSIADPGGRARWDQISVFNRPVTATSLAHQYLSYFSPRVFFLAGNGHPGQTATPPGLGVEPLMMLPLATAGILWLVWVALRAHNTAGRQSAQFLLSALLLYPIPAALTVQDVPHLGRGAQVIPLLALIAAIGFVTIADLAKHPLGANGSRRPYWVAVPIILTGALLSELIVRYEDYFFKYANRPRVLEYYQYGMEQAVGYAQAHKSEYDTIWMSNDNQTYIYVLFFTQWPPSDVHRRLAVRRNPPEFNEVDAIAKYRFGTPPDVAVRDLVLLNTIKDPLGRTAYEIRGGRTAQGRVLVISRPA
jgi:4-amino-4-deoxy-L-arabinose transferase-like glycosyltransferase